MTHPPPQHKVAFVLGLSRAMHRAGYAAHRLEDVLSATAQQLGVEAQFFTTPTSIFVSFGPEDDQRTYLLRVEPADVDLSRLAHLDRVLQQVLRGDMTPSAGAAQVAEVVRAPAPYGPVLTTLAFGISSAAAARFFGGGGIEIATAGLIGLWTGLLAILVPRAPSAARIFEPLAAFCAAVIAALVTRYVAPVSVFVAMLSGLIILLPGYTLTVAMTELATRHLASGTARLSGVLLGFLTITFGMALGTTLTTAWLGPAATVTPTQLPLWTELVALVAAPLGFGILLRAEPRDLGWVALAAWLAFGAARLGAGVLGPELGAFVGALTVGLAGNLYGLALNRPTQIPQAPGVLILVPGSLGFRSVAALLDREVVSGVEAAFTMVLVATALVAGILVANVLVPRRKSG